VAVATHVGVGETEKAPTVKKNLPKQGIARLRFENFAERV
jgi:hypothetical protein